MTPAPITCETCRYVDRFHPRPDAVARALRLGCRYPGVEGYTQEDTPQCGGVFYRPVVVAVPREEAP